MRTLTDHILEGDSANSKLEITVLDEPGQEGASCRYEIRGFDTASNDSSTVEEKQYRFSSGTFLFQNGPIKEFGVNGITNEVMLGIVIDRLRGFQSGPFANECTYYALRDCEKALSLLKMRTRDRISRGVEGTTQA
jgi:hypothetical protein